MNEQDICTEQTPNEKEKKPLCPFKIRRETETNLMDGKTTTRDYFGSCAGVRCMAFCEGDVEQGVPPFCRRMNGGAW